MRVMAPQSFHNSFMNVDSNKEGMVQAASLSDKKKTETTQ